VEAFHYLALFGIGAITAYAAVVTFLDMLGKGGVSVDDILLLFIYLELGAMVGIYFKTNHMPIRFLLYVAITALTRLLIGDVSHHKAPDVGLLYLCGGILLLAFAILVVRYASYRYPSTKVWTPTAGSGRGQVGAGEQRLARRRMECSRNGRWRLLTAGSEPAPRQTRSSACRRRNGSLDFDAVNAHLSSARRWARPHACSLNETTM
jgi:phosphate starvation-inducible membrane PsiE